MMKKILQFIVILLSILIIVCFVALIGGMYLKISGNQNNYEYNNQNYSLGLEENEKIINIQVLNNNQLLFVISNSIDTSGIVYDIKANKIISKIYK